MHILRHYSVICRMIKIEHSIFVLPFAYAGAFIAARGWPGLSALAWLTIAMLGLRAFALGVGMVADLPYDRKRSDTSKLPLVRGEITPWQTWRFCGVMGVLFVLACAAMNPVCLALSPVALVITALYSYIKRFTWLCHFALGAVLAIAPIGGWLCVSPHFSLPMLLLGLGMLFWVSGFDALYSCQSVDFDAQSGLHSLPVRFGLQGALIIAAFSHVMAVLFWLLAGLDLSLGWYLCLGAAAAILWWEHGLVSPDRLNDIHFAFALNGPVSLLLLVGAVVGS